MAAAVRDRTGRETTTDRMEATTDGEEERIGGARGDGIGEIIEAR